MIETLTHESFEPHIGTAFQLSIADESEQLTLTEVAVQPESPHAHRRGFTLIFRGARTDTVFDGHIYTLNHAEMGTLDLFLAPLNRKEDGTFLYQAVFN